MTLEAPLPGELGGSRATAVHHALHRRTTSEDVEDAVRKASPVGLDEVATILDNLGQRAPPCRDDGDSDGHAFEGRETETLVPGGHDDRLRGGQEARHERGVDEARHPDARHAGEEGGPPRVLRPGEHEREAGPGAVHPGPRVGETGEVLALGRAPGRDDEGPLDLEPCQRLGTGRPGAVEGIVDTVVDDMRWVDPEGLDRLAGAVGRDADDGRGPADLLRGRRYGGGLVGVAPRHDVVEGDDVAARRRGQLELHPVHHGVMGVEDPADLPPKPGGRHGHGSQGHPPVARETGPQGSHCDAVDPPGAAARHGGRGSSADLMLVHTRPEDAVARDGGDGQVRHPPILPSCVRSAAILGPSVVARGEPVPDPRHPRVALITSSYHPHVGGVEEHVRQVARELRSAGHQVEVWTVDRGEHLGVQKLDGTEVRYLPTPLPARSSASLVRLARDLPAAVWGWCRAYRALRPDVLHVHCFGPNGVYALALHRLTRTPMIVTSHGETLADDHDVYARSALLRRSLRGAVAQADAVTAPSRYVLRDLRSRFGLVGGTVVPNGVGPAPVPLPEVRRDPALRRVVAVGRMERMKGFDLLLEAVEATGRRDIEVVLGGDGSSLGELRELAASLGLGERVHFLGRLYPDEVAAQMAAADVVVVPSRREAFGIVALEAWRAKTPLVGTVHGGMAEFVRDDVDGVLVDPLDTQALGNAIEDVLSDATRAGRLCAAGLERLACYSWEQVARRYVHLYLDVGRTRAGPSGTP